MSPLTTGQGEKTHASPDLDEAVNQETNSSMLVFKE
jgi:hypothetical protein